MKKLILIALAFVSLQAIAQDKQKAERKTKAEHMKNMSAEDQATIVTKKLTLALDLSEDQQTKVKEIMLSQANFRKDKMAQKAKMKNSKEVKGTVKIENAKEINVKKINEKLDHKIEIKKKMKEILTDEQYKKWEGMQGRRHSKTKEKNIIKAKH